MYHPWLVYTRPAQSFSCMADYDRWADYANRVQREMEERIRAEERARQQFLTEHPNFLAGCFGSPRFRPPGFIF